MKTVLQAKSSNKLDAATMRRLLAQSGSLWRGATPPVMGGALYSSASFPTYRAFLGLVHRPAQGETVAVSRFARDAFVAGTLSGWVSVFITTPFEMCKTQLMLAPEANGGHRGAFSAEFARLYRAGGARALYTGWAPMLWRDGPGSGVYFGTYSVLKRDPFGSGVSPAVLEFFAGGVAGVACWVAALPFVRRFEDRGVGAEARALTPLARSRRTCARRG